MKIIYCYLLSSSRLTYTSQVEYFGRVREKGTGQRIKHSYPLNGVRLKRVGVSYVTLEVREDGLVSEIGLIARDKLSLARVCS